MVGSLGEEPGQFRGRMDFRAGTACWILSPFLSLLHSKLPLDLHRKRACMGLRRSINGQAPYREV